jgi:peptide/nickel transport system permease protein
MTPPPDDKPAAMPASGEGERAHFVSSAPFDPSSVEKLSPEQERYYLAGQWKLMWWKLKRHRIAVVSLWVLAILYFMAFLAEPLSPYSANTRNPDFI